MSSLPSDYGFFPTSLQTEYENLIDSALNETGSEKGFDVIADLVHKRIGVNEERGPSLSVGKAALMFEHPEYCTTPPYKEAFKRLFEERVLKKEMNPPSPQTHPIENATLSNAQLLSLCSVLYPLVSIPGVCHGLSLLGVQAILTHHLEKFHLRFEKISALLSFHNNDFVAAIKQIQREEDFDLLAFFEALEVGMEGYRYPFLFSNDQQPAFQTDQLFAPAALSLLASDELQESGHLDPVASFTGVYSEKELEEHFASLREVLLESPAATEPVALFLKGTTHAITVGFDPKEDQWKLIDAEALSTTAFNTAQELADHLKKSLKSGLTMGGFISLDDPEESISITPIATMIYVGNEEKSLLEGRISTWRTQSRMTSLQNLKTPKALATWFDLACIAQDLPVFHALLDLERGEDELKRDFLIASRNGNTEMIRTFLDRDRTLLERYGRFDESPLDSAASSGRIETVELLLSKGANIHQGNPIAKAAAAGRLEMIQFLISKGAHVKESQAIHLAALFGHEEVVRCLLPLQKEELNTRNERGNTLANAIVGRNPSIIQLLLDAGADIHGDEYCRCPIHAAAELSDSAMLKKLLDMGVDINTEGSQGTTPLHVAVRAGREETVDLLLKRGASLLEKNHDWMSPLDLAARWGHTKLTQMLVEEGQKRGENFLNKGKEPRTSPLHYAIEGRHAKTALILLNSVADPSETDLSDRTPLMAAAGNGLLEVVQSLLEKGVSLDEKDYSGKTALHYAARDGQSDVVSALLAAGASLNEETEDGETAKDLALKAGADQTAALLSSTL